MQCNPSPLLSVTGIYKRFGTTQALADVDLELWSGEVHCLVGENGAGKSTLAKIIAGVEQADSGAIFVDQQRVSIRDVNRARELGIGVVYQHPIIFPDLDVTENIFAGRQLRTNSGWWHIIDRRRMERQVVRLLDSLGVDINPRTPLASLSVADQQLIEIVKALAAEAKLLVLDEPTASLSRREVAALFAIVKRLVQQGVAVLFITHRLDEVFELGDRITVLRDGHRVATTKKSVIDRGRLIELMVGRPLDVLYPKQFVELGDVVLKVEGLGRRGIFANVGFSARAGEILGLAGLIGAGRTDVARTLFGVEPLDTGQVWIRGIGVRPRWPGQMLRHGLAYVSEDRHGSGLILQWPIFMNISLPLLHRLRRWAGLANAGLEREVAEQYAKRLTIRPPQVDPAVQYLSGGNQQKVLLAKWLATDPAVLILDEPTRGIDVGAKAEVHRVITELVAEGIGIILISSELPELLAMCDRILVFCEGRIVGAFWATEATQETVMRAATDHRTAVTNVLAHGTAGLHPLDPAPSTQAGLLQVNSSHSVEPPERGLADSRKTATVPDNELSRSAALGSFVTKAARHVQDRVEKLRPGRGQTSPFGANFRESGLILFGLLIIGFASVSPQFLTVDSFRSILSTSAITIVAAAGMTAVIVARQIDLSVGAILGISAYAVGTVLSNEAHPLLAAGLAIAIGALLGLGNAALVAGLRVPSIIATLGTASIYRGVLFVIAARSIGYEIHAAQLPAEFRTLSSMRVAGIPLIIVIALSTATIVGLILSFTDWGRNLYAIGSNPDGARYAGIHTGRTVSLALVLVGAVAGLGGFLYVMRFATVNVRTGTGFEFDVIAAVVLGGIAIFGGSGRVLGAVLGALLLSTLGRGFVLTYIPEFWKVVATGMAIVGAVTIDAILARRRAARLRWGRRPHLQVEQTSN